MTDRTDDRRPVSLIPTFEVGEKAILHFQPYEMACPVCHRVLSFKTKPFMAKTVIIPHSKMILVRGCKHKSIYPEGFYTVDVKVGRKSHLAVPYTLLEHIGGEL